MTQSTQVFTCLYSILVPLLDWYDVHRSPVFVIAVTKVIGTPPPLR